MRGILPILLFFCVFLGPAPDARALIASIGESGAPLPRLISLAASEAYMRTGPGRQYPRAWVYRRRMLPLEVIDEHGAWRQVRDFEGVTGWMHVSLLSSRRTAIILGATRKLYSDPNPASAVRITAEPGVIGDVIACDGIWCQLTIDGTEGWIERRYIWGVYDREVID